MTDRLTEMSNGNVQLKAARNSDGLYCVCPEICDDVEDKYGNVECCGNCPIQKAFDRLAAYEDTNLMPDEIKDHEEMFKAYRHVCGGLAHDEIPHWIPVSEPPQKPGDYLVWREGHARPDIMRWRKNAGFDDHAFPVYGKVLYWAYLIQPPKGEKHGTENAE